MTQATEGGLCTERHSNVWSEEMIDSGQELEYMKKDVDRSRGKIRTVILLMTIMKKNIYIKRYRQCIKYLLYVIRKY